MSFLDKLSARMPFGKKEEILEYFFALNISSEKLTVSLWTIDGRELKISGIASEKYSSLENISSVTDKLLDSVLGIREINVQKILFGVPNSWLADENLKEEYLKILKSLVKELELTPMAYVESSNALVHLLEKTEGVPPTAILVGFDERHLTVSVVRAGKLDGVKIITRGDNSGSDIEKALLAFTAVETLPSKILIYGENTDELKGSLLSFSWMSKLSFLHFPKIESLPGDIDIKSICLAGASEIKDNVLYVDQKINESVKKTGVITVDEEKELPEKEEKVEEVLKDDEKIKENTEKELGEDFGFVVGDVAENKISEEKVEDETEVEELDSEEKMDSSFVARPSDGGETTEDKEDLVSNIESVPSETNIAEMDDFEKSMEVPDYTEKKKFKFSLNMFLGSILGLFKIRGSKSMILLVVIVGILGMLLASYLLLPKVQVKVFVEPKIIEKDAQVTADPSQKVVNEDAKIIPGQIIQTEVSGTDKESATGKKQIGDPAKGTVNIINNSTASQTLSKGTTISSSGIKFTLDSTVNIASTSATSASKATATVKVTAASVGADGNLPSGTQFTSSSSQIAILAEGNFSGGTSKEVTVVSSDDQQRLLAKLSGSLRQQAQQKLQDQYKLKKILEEALSENIVKKTFSKNINDQASEFSLNLTVNYKGTAYEDSDLRTIVAKLVNTQVPDGFLLDLSDTETQADVSKLEKDGRLIFLAKFRAKLLPKIDSNQVVNKIKGKSLNEATDIIKAMENVLGSEIIFSPKLPGFLQRIPILGRNIKVDVGLK